SLAAVGACASAGGAPAAPGAVPASTVQRTMQGTASAVTPGGGLVGAPNRAPLGSRLSAADARWIDSAITALPLRDRVAQLVTVWVLGDYVNRDDPAFVQIRRWIGTEHVGGVIMSLGSPLEVAAKINAMQRLALATPSRLPLLVSSDLEPGLGRFEGGVFVPQLWSAGTATVLPTNMAVGATGRAEDAEAVGRVVAEEARAAGVHVVFAPDADVNNNPANPVINVRSFGEDPQAVARMTAAFIRGVQGEGVAAVAKHFPGHGDTDADSHIALPVVRSDRARLDSVEFVPFRAAIAAGVAGVMTAHLALPAVQGDTGELTGVPATLSPRVMTGLLRDTLHFTGLTVTDALTMEGIGHGFSVERACPLAVAAGDDLLLMPTDVARCVDAVVAAVGRGTIAPDRIDAALRRLLTLKAQTGALARPIVDLESLRDVVGAPAHWALARDVAARAVTLLRDSAQLVPARSARSIAAVVYAPDNELTAGQSFLAELGGDGRAVRTYRISPRSSPAALDSIGAAASTADRLVVMTYTRTFEGNGRLAIPAHVAAWIDREAIATHRVVVVAAGNPYVIRQFPHVGTYLVTYGRGDALERASARAVLGRAPITGRVPVSLPGYFARGDGLTRDATTASAATATPGGARE
ncbi:MAG TPA: glycoside hydrolase family 3 protein, partial [Gemmatirosa sp.]